MQIKFKNNKSIIFIPKNCQDYNAQMVIVNFINLLNLPQLDLCLTKVITLKFSEL